VVFSLDYAIPQKPCQHLTMVPYNTLRSLIRSMACNATAAEAIMSISRLLVSALALAGLLAAQDPPSRTGRISYINGAVSFAPAGVNNWVAAAVNRPLTMGDQIYADQGGRAEVHIPGTAFRLGDRTAFEFMDLDDRTAQIRLSSGELDIRLRRLAANLEIDTPNLAFMPSRPGEYRVDVNTDNGQTYVTVRDGEGQVTTAAGAVTVHAGQQAQVVGAGQQAQYKINAAPGYDRFDRWVISRNQREDRYANARYVSPDMVGYEDLGEYGTWRETPDYGEVWVPNSVAAGWAPYHDGHWAWIDPWGWTWVDDAPWGFAPFHYGRWAYVGGYWGWCPGPVAVAPVYAPALVAWVGFGAGFGISVGWSGGPAVGWFPLGPRDVYVPAFTASAAFVTRINVTNTRITNTAMIANVYNGYVRTGAVPIDTYMNRSVPGAVVAVPPGALASARPVQQVAMRVQPAQIGALRAAAAAPHVTPDLASRLGHAAAGHVAPPPAAVLNRPVVSRTTPPARPVIPQSAHLQPPPHPQPALPARPAPPQVVHTRPPSAPARPYRPPAPAAHTAPPQVAHAQHPAAPHSVPLRQAPPPHAAPPERKPPERRGER
jgi:hypothetical protein